MSVEYIFDKLVLVHRPHTTSPDAPVGAAGDVVEIHCAAGPCREVDPLTREATAAVQCFLSTGDGTMRPVSRQRYSWPAFPIAPPQVQRAPMTALEAYERKTGIHSSKARMR